MRQTKEKIDASQIFTRGCPQLQLIPPHKYIEKCEIIRIQPQTKSNNAWGSPLSFRKKIEKKIRDKEE